MDIFSYETEAKWIFYSNEVKACRLIFRWSENDVGTFPTLNLM